MKTNSGVLPSFAWPLFLLLAIAAILLLSVSEPQDKVEAPVPPQLYSSSYQLLGTGNRLGTYYPVGHILADWFNSNLGGGEEVFKAIETNGSVDNVRLLQEGKITLALVESRIVQEAFAGNASSSLRLVWPLWPDVVQLIRSAECNDAELDTLDIGFPGQKNSSTYRTSTELFSAFGLNIEKIAVNILPERVLADLASGKIKFAMIQAGVPNRSVSDALIFNGCSLYSFSEDGIEKGLHQVATSRVFKIPAGYYGENQPEIVTFGIPNVMVASAETSSSTVKLLTELLSRSSAALKIRHQALADVVADAAEAKKLMGEIGVPIHPGTEAWLQERLAENRSLESEN
jgi:TRAP transporter TAXI family solute receptor